jgi:hypothetical protein
MNKKNECIKIIYGNYVHFWRRKANNSYLFIPCHRQRFLKFQNPMYGDHSRYFSSSSRVCDSHATALRNTCRRQVKLNQQV